MNKKHFLFFCALVFIIGIGFSKSKKKAKAEKTPVAPMWIEDEGRLKMFPPDEYVSAIGMGNTEQESQNKASAQISKSIKTEITSNVESSYQAMSDLVGDSKSSYSETRKLTQDIKSLSDNALFKVEFTKPYFDENYGMFLCVAYINRDDAWQMIKPKLEVSSKAFTENYAKANNVNDNFQKVLAIKNAQKSLSDFYDVYDFALFINTSEASKYKTTDDLVQKSYSDIYFLSQNCVICVFVDKDSQDRIKNKVAEKLTRTGFTVGALKCNYIFDVKLSYEIKANDELYLAYPSIKMTVYSDSKIVDSYAKDIGKCAAFDKNACERTIYKELEKVIEEMDF